MQSCSLVCQRVNCEQQFLASGVPVVWAQRIKLDFRSLAKHSLHYMHYKNKYSIYLKILKLWVKRGGETSLILLNTFYATADPASRIMKKIAWLLDRQTLTIVRQKVLWMSKAQVVVFIFDRLKSNFHYFTYIKLSSKTNLTDITSFNFKADNAYRENYFLWLI